MMLTGIRLFAQLAKTGFRRPDPGDCPWCEHPVADHKTDAPLAWVCVYDTLGQLAGGYEAECLCCRLPVALATPAG